jgi:predicted kinase
MNYYEKYLKYKKKYLDLKNQSGGYNGKLYILVGPPGSGKSTRAKELATDQERLICEADKFPGLYNARGDIDFKKSASAHASCKLCVENLMTVKEPIIVQANTNLNLGNKGIKPYIEMARKYNYEVDIILPTDDLLYFNIDKEGKLSPEQKREMQIKHLKDARNIRSSDREGFKRVPTTAIDQMVNNFNSLKSEMQELAEIHNPEVILKKIAILTR